MDDDPSATLTWIGHGSVLLRAGGTTLLVDPVLRDRLLVLRRPEPVQAAIATHADLVLITHAHHDHLDLPSLHMLGGAVPMLAPAGADRHLRRAGVGPVRSVYPGFVVEHGRTSIEVVPARHPGGRVRARPGDESVGYVIRSEGLPSVYVAGDTSLFTGMRSIGPVDVAVLPVGGWWRTLGQYHLDPVEAVEAARRLHARVLVPIHWGTFHPALLGRAMRGPWEATAASLVEAVRERAPDLDLRLLRPGQSTTLRMPRAARASA